MMKQAANNVKSSAAVLQELKELYRKLGYAQFKMSRFEEYDTYVQIKDFLISDKVITFTDINGKLLAMKPDVTVSIIKNTDDTQQAVQKVYYNENVYRVSGSDHAFKEIMQAGLECIGEIDAYNICEVIMLAVKSLAIVSSDFVLDISHMGFVTGLLSSAAFSAEETAAVLTAVSEKNAAELFSVCEKKGLSKELTEKIISLVSVYGPIKDVIARLDQICMNDEMKAAVHELSVICEALRESGLDEHIQLDFSVVNDMNYYNGIVFRGYIEGIPTGVLSGGRYDKLMHKMGKGAKAIGFAVYLDQLERLRKCEDGFDVDVLLCYDDSCTPAAVMAAVREITAGGKTVLAQKQATANLRYRQKMILTRGGAEVENG